MRGSVISVNNVWWLWLIQSYKTRLYAGPSPSRAFLGDNKDLLRTSVSQCSGWLCRLPQSWGCFSVSRTIKWTERDWVVKGNPSGPRKLQHFQQGAKWEMLGLTGISENNPRDFSSAESDQTVRKIQWDPKLLKSSLCSRSLNEAKILSFQITAWYMWL